MTNEKGIVKQTTWWPYELFCRFMKGHTIAVHLASAAYDGPTKPAWVRGLKDTPFLDVSATLDDDGWVSLAVVNLHLESDLETSIGGVAEGSSVKVYTISGSHAKVTNVAGKEEVKVEESDWDGKNGKFIFPKCSVTLLRWHT
jgi:alpha-N-arabinofuranosidase